jgi:hypothetical protein
MTASSETVETPEEKEEGPLFTNSYDLLNAIQDDIRTLEHKCNNAKTLANVVMFWDKSKLDLFKISTELQLLKLLLEKGR